ncbi:tetratricopeptide repeat protein [Flavobacterium enshiense]|uniref:tetratricopeptide repeat protein n=1 Tax=Flavobacterium enshiense TaxID=1341165 RepID=UPI00345DB39D
MNENKHSRSIEFLTKAQIIAERGQFYKEHFLAINNIAANYCLMLEYGEALNYYFQAYSISMQKLDSSSEMVVLNNIAVLYAKKKNFDKAYEYSVKAYRIAKKNRDTIRAGMYAINIGNILNETGKIKRARNFFLEAVLFLKVKPDFLLMAEIGLAESDLLNKNFFQARKSAVNLLRSRYLLKDSDHEYSLLMLIANSYFEENNPKDADKYVNALLDRNPNLEVKIEAFQLLSKIHLKNKSLENAIRYKDSVFTAHQKLNEINNAKLFENSKVKFELQNYKSKISDSEKKRTQERKIFVFILIAIVFTVLLFVWNFKNSIVKHKQIKLLAEKEQQILALELEREKNENLLRENQLKEKEALAFFEQERLKKEIDFKNRKLSSKTLYLSERNQIIEDILSKLSNPLSGTDDTSLDIKIKSLRDQLNIEEEWDSFILHFEEVNQDFLKKIKGKHPNLTAGDIRYISYIYMNLSTKEIATMLNITPEACRKRKERISVKMKLPDNISFYEYLTTFQ